MCDSIVVKETSKTQAMQPSAVFIITELITVNCGTRAMPK